MTVASDEDQAETEDAVVADQPLLPSASDPVHSCRAEVPLASPVVIGVQRRRRRKRQCPVCHGTVKARRVGDGDAGVCAGCGSVLAEDARTWDCRACSFSLCEACAPLVALVNVPSQTTGVGDEPQSHHPRPSLAQAHRP